MDARHRLTPAGRSLLSAATGPALAGRRGPTLHPTTLSRQIERLLSEAGRQSLLALSAGRWVSPSMCQYLLRFGLAEEQNAGWRITAAGRDALRRSVLKRP